MKNIPLLKLKAFFLFFFCAICVIVPEYQVFAQSYKIKTIVVDAGHGGKDGATRGLYSTEKDVALRTALNLGKAIEAALKDVKVIYTRTDDTFIPLYERIKIANDAKADLFISVHCNNMPLVPTRTITGYKKNSKGKRVPIYKTTYRKSTSTHGVETFVSGIGRVGEQDEVIKRENASMFLEENYKQNYDGFLPDNPENSIILSLMKNAFRTQSLNFARMIQDEYVRTGRVDRGVQEQSLAVLARAGMPAVLTEIGFISNPAEEDYLNSEIGQVEVVNCILNAIKAYKKSVEI